MRVFLFGLLFPLLGIAQQTDVVDFLKITALIRPFSEEKKVEGEYIATFRMLKATDSVYLDAVQMKLTEYLGEDIKIEVRDKKWMLISKFEAGKTYDVAFSYEATPKQTLYFTGNQIWTQGQGKYTSHWLPSIDDMNDKIEFDLQFYTASGETVVANGNLKGVLEIETSRTWQYDMQRPMSSYLVAFAMGDFQKAALQSAGGVPIELYISTADTAKLESTYRYSKQIFDFLETEIEVPYPWQNYKQVPVRDFLYAGMENTSCTIFSEAFVVDDIAFNDRNYVNVNAHELAHQWFGNLVTETESTHHWLHEGFATYYALLAEKELFGEDYYYWKLLNSAENLEALSAQGKGESLLNPKASSLTFYEKGAWALHILKELIGEDSFKKGVKHYLEKHSFGNVTTEDFLTEIRAVTIVDISDWEADWLKQTAFKAEQAYKSVVKSSMAEQYFAVSALRGTVLKEKGATFRELLADPNDFIGQELIYQLAEEDINEALPYFEQGMESGNMYVRQAIASSLQIIPPSFKASYETLLSDPSYVTKETALYQLWANFGEDRKRYLDQTKDWVGFHNKNLRQLWLALAISTPTYKPSAQVIFKEELRNYTGDLYSFEVRQQAFRYVLSLGMYDQLVIDNLINASVHHNWRFRQASRALLSEAFEKPGITDAVTTSIVKYSEAEQAYLKKVLL